MEAHLWSQGPALPQLTALTLALAEAQAEARRLSLPPSSALQPNEPRSVTYDPHFLDVEIGWLGRHFWYKIAAAELGCEAGNLQSHYAQPTCRASLGRREGEAELGSHEYQWVNCGPHRRAANAVK